MNPNRKGKSGECEEGRNSEAERWDEEGWAGAIYWFREKESDPPKVVRDDEADHVAKGRAEKQSNTIKGTGVRDIRKVGRRQRAIRDSRRLFYLLPTWRGRTP